MPRASVVAAAAGARATIAGSISAKTGIARARAQMARRQEGYILLAGPANGMKKLRGELP